MNESSELPDWVKFSQDENSTVADSEDDFVLPIIVNWVNNQKVHGHNIDVRYASNGTMDKDVDKISRILKSRFKSPDAVIQAIDGCNVDISKSLVEKLLKRFSNDWTSAFGFFKWANVQKGYKHSPDSYDSMVDILGKSKQFVLMWELVEEMVQLGGHISLVTMSKIMRRLAAAGKWTDAIEAFHKIERFGVSKDTSAMNVLLDTLCKEQSVEHAQDAFLEFKNEILPDHRTFNVLTHGWCKARQLDKARWTMGEMERHGFHPCVISYTSLIEAYCREKDFRKVDATLDEMQEKGCPPNVVTYTIVMHSLGKAKQTNEALEVYDRMKRNGCVPDTSFYNSLIYILSKAGRLQDARDVYEEMLKSGLTPNVTTHDTMISAACEHSQEETALKLLQEMEEGSCKPELTTYAPLLKMCCRKKRMKVLFYLLNDMFKKDIGLELGTYSLLVHGLCRSGKLEVACFFFEEIVLKGLVPKDCTYSMLIEELKKKNMEKAKEKIQQLMLQAKSVEQSGHCSRMHVKLQDELEAWCMTKLRRLGVSTTVLYAVDPVLHTLRFEYGEGPPIKDVFLDFGSHGIIEKQMVNIVVQIGNEIGKLHDGGLIHCDLTTSKMFFSDVTQEWCQSADGSNTSCIPEVVEVMVNTEQACSSAIERSKPNHGWMSPLQLKQVFHLADHKVASIRAMLRCFKVDSGLGINLSKSTIVGVGEVKSIQAEHYLLQSKSGEHPSLELIHMRHLLSLSLSLMIGIDPF
ncbi:hypothetical protein HHK36_022685 [Tetracentron sinense]|uniref:PROP1-like PPR domain-containing protein n=1 Tax=Tetracentron sinense TaxID=13715 RepID=A0A835D6C2_TETSI|nr:hypothetical protein HHK36_022685 [Tetracentron sinense]